MLTSEGSDIDQLYNKDVSVLGTSCILLIKIFPENEALEEIFACLWTE